MFAVSASPPLVRSQFLTPSHSPDTLIRLSCFWEPLDIVHSSLLRRGFLTSVKRSRTNYRRTAGQEVLYARFWILPLEGVDDTRQGFGGLAGVGGRVEGGVEGCQGLRAAECKEGVKALPSCTLVVWCHFSSWWAAVFVYRRSSLAFCSGL